MDETVLQNSASTLNGDDVLPVQEAANFQALTAMVDLNMQMLAWSQGWANRYYQNTEKSRFQNLRDHFPNMGTELENAHKRALAGKEAFFQEVEPQDILGHRAATLWRETPLYDEHDVIVGAVVSADGIQQSIIAEQNQRSERDFPLLITAIGIGTVQVDSQSHQIVMSSNVADMLGVSDRDACAILRGWVENLDPFEYGNDRQPHRRGQVQTPGKLLSRVFQLNIHDHVCNVALRGRVVFNDAGRRARSERFVGLLEVSPASTGFQSELERAQRLETVGKIAGIIAHDFNNLLYVMLANLELAALRVSDETTRDLLQRAIDAAQLGGNFNRKLLALSEKSDVTASPIAVDQHIIKTWSILERLLGEDVSIRFAPAAENLCVKIDPAELDAAILNLVLNARDAQPRGGEIVIATKKIEIDQTDDLAQIEGKSGQFLELSICDTGMGMSPGNIQQAQEPFFTTKSQGLGTGLGLTSVAATIARVEGFISIQSKVNEGTRVALFLPLAEGPPKNEAELDEMPFGNGELVLVVEDDAMVREVALKRFEALGYAVIEATNGHDALLLLADGEPIDLVFSDIVMTGSVSGYDVAEVVSQRYPDIAVLLTSGHGSTRYIQPKAQAKLVPLLKKPYTLAVLAHAVQRVLKPTKVQQ